MYVCLRLIGIPLDTKLLSAPGKVLKQQYLGKPKKACELLPFLVAKTLYMYESITMDLGLL